MLSFHEDGAFSVPIVGNVLFSQTGSKFDVSPNLGRKVTKWEEGEGLVLPLQRGVGLVQTVTSTFYRRGS